MPTLTSSYDISLGGTSVSARTTRTESGSIEQEVSLAAAQSGSLTTRTDNDTGVITLAEGHGITDADTVDVYWSGGMRYGMTVTGYDTTTITVDAGSGDNLPVAETAVFATVPTDIDIDVDGDLISGIAVHATTRASADFQTGADASLLQVELAANEPWTWFDSQSITNPLTGDPIGHIQASAGTATAATLKIMLVYDSA